MRYPDVFTRSPTRAGRKIFGQEEQRAYRGSPMIPSPHARRTERTLSDAEVRRYHEQGFLLVDRPVIAPEALSIVQRRLDDLFARFHELPPGHAKDLAPGARTGEPPRIPEITETTKLSPGLLRSEVLAVCSSIARQLHGPSTRLVFDHAIYKPPLNDAATAWHQDAAYAPDGELGVGIWVPLQDVDEEGGCMRFLPGSHKNGLTRHGALASEANPHLLAASVDEDEVATCPVHAGGMVMHNTYTLHSTGPNCAGVTRRVWVLNFSCTTVSGTTRSRARLRAVALTQLAREKLAREKVLTKSTPRDESTPLKRRPHDLQDALFAHGPTGTEGLGKQAHPQLFRAPAQLLQTGQDFSG